MKIQGRDCTLTLLKDINYYPLPYSEETVRQASKGYALPGVIGIRNREKIVETGKAIMGCVVTRLEYNNILALFLLLFYSDSKLKLLCDLHNITVKTESDGNIKNVGGIPYSIFSIILTFNDVYDEEEIKNITL